MFGLSKGKAEITLSKYQFSPGETIEGQFKFMLDKPAVAKSVGISFYGLRQTTQMMSGRRSTRTDKIFDFTQPLDVEKEYPAGESAYSFSLQVPQNLNTGQMPEGTLGTVLKSAQFLMGAQSKVDWYVEGRLDIKGFSFDVSKKVKISIV